MIIDLWKTIVEKYGEKFDYMNVLEKEKQISFNEGAQHVLDKIKRSIEKGDVNEVLKISGVPKDDLWILANALLGGYVKRKE